MTRDQLKRLEDDLWAAADNLRANSDLKASEYSTPVLGLIFLKFADINYRRHEAEIRAEFERLKGTRRERPLHEIAIAKCGLYLPDHARYSYLLDLPEDRNIAKAIEEAMDAIEAYKPELEGSLPKEEKQGETVKLARMNLAVNGLRGEVEPANTYYGDAFGSLGRFDYVLANPPFNVDDVALSVVEQDSRFNTYGLPRNKTKAKKSEQGKETVPNANYLWINLFATSLKEPGDVSPGGRAALVMANSASDARNTEADIRRTLIEKNLIYGMLTLPSNMFYTVTLPATLWFFDKGKTDERVLFIDARNIFTPIDRAHREFSEEQIQNIAVISRLHKGRREAFLALIDRYFASGMERLVENRAQVEPVATQLLEVLDEQADAEAIDRLKAAWDGLEPLERAYAAYQRQSSPLPAGEGLREIEARNTAQRELRATFDPFFAQLHECLKQVDKAVRHHEKALAEQARAAGKRQAVDRATRQLKTALEALHAEVRNAESFFGHIQWLQERFPEARYEDVTGLCKLADLDEIREQDYSLNPGRYVGVVIEEDGKTEEEFVADLMSWQDDLSGLSREVRELEAVIDANVRALTQ
jgi:type I restriction enzyme M protein